MPRRPRHGALGCSPDTPDQRDHLFMAEDVVNLAALPKMVCLRDKLALPPFDQGDLGSCTANAIAAMVAFLRKKEGKTLFVPSRLGIYYGEREIEGTVDSDAGAELRDGMKVLQTVGVSSEDDCPYDPDKFTEKPSEQYFRNAMTHKAVKYKRVQSYKDPAHTLSQMKGCLADGYVFVGGISVYESFDSEAVASTGKVPLPGLTESMLGGHAILIFGFNDEEDDFGCLNSWGGEWGDEGCFTLPQKYLSNTNLSSDFWTLRLQN